MELEGPALIALVNLTCHVNMWGVMASPSDLRLLFELQTKRQDVAAGWWWKIDVWEAKESPGGVRYALSLHDPEGRRVLGYDNDHRRHHCHPPDRGRPYDFTTCEQLICDFFDDVDRFLARKGILP